jgi:hypothetical protein
MPKTLLLLLVAVTVSIAAQTEEQAPVTPPPPKPEWRLGFDLGNMTILETPELQPENNGEYSAANFRLSWISLSKTRIDAARLVNPRQWAVLDQHGNVRQREFRWLAAVGGYYLVSTTAAQIAGLQPQQTPRPENVVFGVAGLNGPPPQVRTRLTQTAWKNDAPIERADDLPQNYQAVRQALYANAPDADRRVVYGSSMLALVEGRVAKLWLLNYADPDLFRGTRPWGVFKETPAGLIPVFISRGGKYHADLFAGIDADRDGNDDLVVEARYATGTSYKVIALMDGVYREVRDTYYRSR